jgi:hypothetical protein
MDRLASAKAFGRRFRRRDSYWTDLGRTSRADEFGMNAYFLVSSSLVLFGAVTAVIAVRGETWHESSRRPTYLGWIAVGCAAATLGLGIAKEWMGNQEAERALEKCSIENRRLTKASVVSNIDQNGISLLNEGVGPVNITAIDVYIDGRFAISAEAKDWNARVGLSGLGRCIMFRAFNFPTKIGPGRTLPIVEVMSPCPFGSAADDFLAIQELMYYMQIAACACSVYGDCEAVVPSADLRADPCRKLQKPAFDPPAPIVNTPSGSWALLPMPLAEH